MTSLSPRRLRACILALLTLLLSVAAACAGSSTSTPPSVTPTAHDEPPPAFTTTRLLKGPDDVRVTVAEHGDAQALMWVAGAGIPIAGIVFPCEVRNEGAGRTRYATTWHGREAMFLHREVRDGGVRWQIYTGDGSYGPFDLEPDEAGSAAVDTAALWAEHRRQASDGTLASAQAVDRAGIREAAAADFNRRLDGIAQDCGSRPEMSVAWDSIPDEVLAEYSVSGYCENVLQALAYLCQWEPGKQLVREHVRRIECTWGGGMGLSIEGTTLTFRVDPEGRNLHEWARDRLLEREIEGGGTLADAIALAQTDVCRAPDDAHVVVVHPHLRGSTMGISYGTPSALFHSPQPEHVRRGWFFEPREVKANSSASSRYSVYSSVEVDRDANRCTVQCGDRELAWTLLDAGATRALLASAETRPVPFDREPYALARDSGGTYYYVDRGRSEESRRDFRVFSGRRGRMRPLAMRDVASDSEGEVFSTVSGDLRLIVESEQALWIRGTRRTDLRRVPVEENLRMIFVELGVYASARLELPCDDY